MSDEANITASLRITKDNLQYTSEPGTYTADVTGTKGPTPGAIDVPVTGADVDLSELTIPGFCVLQNLDETNFVTYGIKDPETLIFYPLGELLPGEVNLLRLARDIGQEEGTGAGTGNQSNTFHFIADTDSCNVVISAFEK